MITRRLAVGVTSLTSLLGVLAACSSFSGEGVATPASDAGRSDLPPVTTFFCNGFVGIFCDDFEGDAAQSPFGFPKGPSYLPDAGYDAGVDTVALPNRRVLQVESDGTGTSASLTSNFQGFEGGAKPLHVEADFAVLENTRHSVTLFLVEAASVRGQAAWGITLYGSAAAPPRGGALPGPYPTLQFNVWHHLTIDVAAQPDPEVKATGTVLLDGQLFYTATGFTAASNVGVQLGVFEGDLDTMSSSYDPRTRVQFDNVIVK